MTSPVRPKLNQAALKAHAAKIIANYEAKTNKEAAQANQQSQQLFNPESNLPPPAYDSNYSQAPSNSDLPPAYGEELPPAYESTNPQESANNELPPPAYEEAKSSKISAYDAAPEAPVKAKNADINTLSNSPRMQDTRQESYQTYPRFYSGSQNLSSGRLIQGYQTERKTNFKIRQLRTKIIHQAKQQVILNQEFKQILGEYIGSVLKAIAYLHQIDFNMITKSSFAFSANSNFSYTLIIKNPLGAVLTLP